MYYLVGKYKKLSVITRYVLAIVILNVAFAFILRSLTGDSTSLYTLKTFFLDKKTNGDSWEAMIAASEYIKENPDGHVYDALLYQKKAKFQYPPSSLLVFDLPQKIMGWSYTKIAYWLDRISWICVFLIGLVTARIIQLVLKEKRFEKFRLASDSETGLFYSLICISILLFYPVTWSYKLGQIQTILTLLATLALLCWQTDKKYLAGIMIGIICLIKPQLAIVFIWALIRRQWKMLIAGSIVVVVFLLISINMYGYNNHIDYLSVLSFLSRRGEAYYPNQSVNGLLNRFLFNGDNLTWSGYDFPPYSPIVYVFTLITSLSLMLFGLLRQYKNRYPGIIDFGAIILCTTMASPIAWEHHYGILFSIFFVALPFAKYFLNKKWSLTLLMLSFIVASQNIEVVKKLADTRFNILQSYLFFGACVILFFLYKISYLKSRREQAL